MSELDITRFANSGVATVYEAAGRIDQSVRELDQQLPNNPGVSYQQAKNELGDQAKDVGACMRKLISAGKSNGRACINEITARRTHWPLK